MAQWTLKKWNENFTLMHKNLSWAGALYTSLGNDLQIRILVNKTESSYIKKQSLQEGDVTAQVQRNHTTEQTNKR